MINSIARSFKLKMTLVLRKSTILMDKQMVEGNTISSSYNSSSKHCKLPSMQRITLQRIDWFPYLITFLGLKRFNIALIISFLSMINCRLLTNSNLFSLCTWHCLLSTQWHAGLQILHHNALQLTLCMRFVVYLFPTLYLWILTKLA